MVRSFLEKGKEGECWDFKQEWHENTADLIKDIICFANTVHDENCYIIFGVSDDLQIKGMQKPRTKQANIIDAISNLIFAGDDFTTKKYQKDLGIGVALNNLLTDWRNKFISTN